MGLSEAGVKLVAQGSSAFNSSIDRAQQAINNFGSQAGSAGAGGLERMSVATIALGTALGNLAAQGLNAAANALTNFISTGINYNKTIENASAQLRVFLGSQDAANEALALAERRAARTPFAFEDYARSLGGIAAIQKQNGGELEDYLDLVERLAAANPAEGFEGATFALREAMSGDFLSLQDRFNIPKGVIADLRESGASVETLDAALTGLGYTTELVSGLADTFDGRWSTLMDTFTTSSGIFTQPIFDALSEGLFGLQGSLNENLPEIQAKLASAGQFVADAITSFRQGWEGDWVDSDIIQPAHRVAGVLGTNVKEAVEKVGGAWQKWLDLTTKVRDFWANPWLQDTVVTPLSDLATQIRDDFLTDWGNLGQEWEDLNTAGLAFNDLMIAGQGLWDTAVGLFEKLGIKMGEMNIPQSEAVTLGEHLVIIFKGMSKIAVQARAGLDLIYLGLSLVSFWAEKAMENYEKFLDTVQGGAEYVVNQAIDTTPPPITGPKGGGSAPPKVMAPVVPSAPPGAGGRGQTTHNTTIVVPPGTSPAVAASIVADGYQRALRSQGLA